RLGQELLKERDCPRVVALAAGEHGVEPARPVRERGIASGLGDREAPIREGPTGGRVAVPLCHAGEPDCPAEAALIAELVPDSQALLERRVRRGVTLLEDGQPGRGEERPGASGGPPGRRG